MKEMYTPELCLRCYWRLSRCGPPDRAEQCDYFTDLSEDAEPVPEPEYEAGGSAWERAGFTVFENAEVMVRYFRESDD